MPDQKAPPYLVKITCKSYGSKAPSQGSGVYIAPDLVLTCRHVVRPKGTSNWATEIQVDGVAAKVFKPTEQTKIQGFDLAVLQVSDPLDATSIPPWRKSRQFYSSDKVTALGFPGGRFDQRDFGVLQDGAKHLQVNGKFDEGASGGVLTYGEHPGYWCCALIAEHAEVAGNAIQYDVVASYLEQLDEKLPCQAMPLPPVKIANEPQYRSKIRGGLRFINLGGLAINGAAQPVDVDRLWVAAVTQSQGQGEIPLAQAINEHRVVVVEAEAGSGKTTFLQRIGYAALRRGEAGETVQINAEGLPLWVPLRSLEEYIEANKKKGDPYPSEAKDLRWLQLYLASKAEAIESGLDGDFFSARLREKKPQALLLLDGLDEVSVNGGADMRALISEAIQKLHCRIVISTRPEVYLQSGALRVGLFAGAERFPILPMSDAAVGSFISLWTEFAAKTSEEKQQQSNLLKLAIARPAIRRYARNPLMLTAMAVLTKSGRTLPEERASFFHEIVTWMIQSRNHKDPKRLRRLLRELAWKMIEASTGNQYQISIGKAAFLIRENFESKPDMKEEEAAIEFLEEVQRSTGLLTLRGAELSFWHRYLQEFLAAERLSTWREGRIEWVPQLVQRRNSAEVLRLLVGLMSEQPEDLTDALLPLVQSALTQSLEEQAYLVGIVGSAIEDLKVSKVSDYLSTAPYKKQLSGEWEKLNALVTEIFRDTPRAAIIPIKIRAAAADALGQAGDIRLKLPDQAEYWVELEGGEFWMGAQKKAKGRKDYDPDAENDENREKENPVAVASFAIGKFPVTVYEYDTCLQDLALTPHPEMRFDEQLKFPNRPVVRLTAFEAEAYCQWASAKAGMRVRLPSEEEWEFAARGKGDPRRYPWGKEEPGENHANFGMNVGALTPVGLFPRGATPRLPDLAGESQIYDLAGNVWEWTASPYGGDAETRVLRGGSYYDSARFLRSAYRNDFGAGVRVYDFGFRCVREVTP